MPTIREIRKSLQKIYETHIVTFGTKVTKHTGFSQHGGWSLISVFCFGCYSNLIGQGRMLLQNIPTPWGRKSKYCCNSGLIFLSCSKFRPFAQIWSDFSPFRLNYRLLKFDYNSCTNYKKYKIGFAFMSQPY